MALKMQGLREESTQRLRELLVETKEKLFQHRFRLSSGEGVNPHEARSTRRDIARMETLLGAVEMVKEAGVDEAGARELLEQSGWDLGKALRAARAGAAEGPAGG